MSLEAHIATVLGVEPGAMAAEIVGVRSRGGDLLALAEWAKGHALKNAAQALSVGEAIACVAGASEPARVRALAACVHALCYLNRFDEATGVIARAQREAREGGLEAELAKLSIASVQPLARAGRLAQAEELARGAIQLFGALGDADLVAKARTNLGIVLRMQDKAGAAVEQFDAALATMTDPVSRAVVQSNRASALLDLDRFADAQAAFEESFAGFQTAKNEMACAIVEGNLADLHARRGELDRALACFEAARQIYRRIGALGDDARLLAEEADGLATLGATGAGISRYIDAIPALDGAGLPREAARASLGLGHALLAEGRGAEARRWFEDAARRYEALNLDAYRAEAEAGCGRVDALSGDEGRGIEALARARAALEGRPTRAARAGLDLASLLVDTGRLEQAARELERVESGTAAVNVAPLHAGVEHVRGGLHAARGDAGAARAALVRAVAIAERTRDDLRAERLRSGFLHSRRQVYLDAASACLDVSGTDALPRAFECLERMRARSLLDGLGAQRPEAWRGAAGAAVDEYRRVVGDLRALYNRLDVGAGPAPSPDTTARLQALERQRERILDRFALGEEAPVALRPVLSLDEAIARVPSDAAFVAAFGDADALSLMLVTSGGARVFRRVCTLADLETGVRRVELAADRAQARTGGAGAHAADPVWTGACASLARMVLEPVAADLAGMGRVAFAPFGPLHAVPLAALPLGGTPVVERWTLSVVPSVTVGLVLQDTPAAAPARMRAVGFSDDRAPSMQAEAADIAALWPGACALIGDAATGEAVKDAAGADVVHIAAHCVFDPLHPASARIKLADGWLTAQELTGRCTRGSTVVLAGCDTGRASVVSPEERLGLVRTFLASGARSVVALTRPLHDDVSRALFVDMHRSMASGAPPARALAQAQRRAAAAGVHPALWSPAFVTGAAWS